MFSFWMHVYYQARFTILINAYYTNIIRFKKVYHNLGTWYYVLPADLLWDIALWLHLFSPKRSRSELPLPRYRKSMKGLLTVLFFRQGWNMKLASFVFVCCRHTSKSSAAVERVSTTYYYLSRWLSFVVLKKKWEVFLRSELDPKCKIPFYCILYVLVVKLF